MIKIITKIISIILLLLSAVLSVVIIVKYAQITSLQNDLIAANGTPFELIDKATTKNELMSSIVELSIWFAISVLLTAVVNFANLFIELFYTKKDLPKNYSKYR